MKHYSFPGTFNYTNYEVAGTDHHGHSLMRVIGRKLKTDEHYTNDSHQATLVPEPDNPHDPNAISVRINEWLVGYLSRDDAENYAKVLHRLAASGYYAITPARVVAFGPRSWKEPNPDFPLDGDVYIALPPVDRIVPLNDHVPYELALLPWGRAAQVRGEEEHLDHLFNFVPPEGTGLIISTLHRAVHTLKNGTEKEYVEVRVDGERAGQISPAVSAQFLPAIRHAEDMDRTLAAWTKLEGSALAVNITVQGARATDLTDEWLNSLPRAPRLVPNAASYSVPPAFGTNNQPPARRPSTRNSKPAKVEPEESQDTDQKATDKNTKAGAGGCCGCLGLIVLLLVLLVLVL